MTVRAVQHVSPPPPPVHADAAAAAEPLAVAAPLFTNVNASVKCVSIIPAFYEHNKNHLQPLP
jgi:hypothetical protein